MARSLRCGFNRLATEIIAHGSLTRAAEGEEEEEEEKERKEPMRPNVGNLKVRKGVVSGVSISFSNLVLPSLSVYPSMLKVKQSVNQSIIHTIEQSRLLTGNEFHTHQQNARCTKPHRP